MTSEIYLGSPDENIVSWIKENFDYSTIPLCFEALEDGNVKLTKDGSPDEISLLYSLDNETWSDWDYETGTDLKSGEKLYIKSSYDNGKFSKAFTECENIYKFSTTGKVNIVGNIMSLLYSVFVDKINLTTCCFNYLFHNCTNLIDASNLILPATTLVNSCYEFMFADCTSLIYAPKLPAIILDSYCYNYMFYNCTSLTSAPELPATTLADGCYSYMFENCTSLTSAPELPATTLADGCYSYMFENCTSLTSAPELPSTTLTNSCYSYMFRNCSGLISVIKLPAITLSEDCYFCMFDNCLNIPELHYPLTIKNDSIFKSIMFTP